MTFDEFTQAFLLMVPLIVISGAVLMFAWCRKKRRYEAEEKRERLLTTAEIQFNYTYSQIYEKSRRDINRGPDYTLFVSTANQSYLKTNMDHEHYWGLVETVVGKSKAELQEEYKNKSQKSVD